MEGRFCLVEPLDPGRHAESLFEANALDVDGRNWTYMPYGPFATFESFRTWMESICSGDDPLFYAIVDRRTEKAVGVASYLRITPSGGSMEVGHINYSPLLQRTRAATRPESCGKRALWSAEWGRRPETHRFRWRILRFP